MEKNIEIIKRNLKSNSTDIINAGKKHLCFLTKNSQQLSMRNLPQSCDDIILKLYNTAVDLANDFNKYNIYIDPENNIVNSFIVRRKSSCGVIFMTNIGRRMITNNIELKLIYQLNLFDLLIDIIFPIETILDQKNNRKVTIVNDGYLGIELKSIYYTRILKPRETNKEVLDVIEEEMSEYGEGAADVVQNILSLYTDPVIEY